MTDSQRIDDLRRRVQSDPASIAFAQLAEECRRAGLFQEAVDVCRTGLDRHPGYLSARVTLGRALMELGDLDGALAELEHVLTVAPENLAAIRGIAQIHHRQGSLVAALARYREALALARNDPDLQQAVDALALQVGDTPLEMSASVDAARADGTLRVAARPEPVEVESASESSEPDIAAARQRAHETIAALEQWLEAIHVARAQPHA